MDAVLFGIVILLWLLFGRAVLLGLFLAPFGIALLVWRKTRSRALCLAALVVALALPNLRWLTTQAVFLLKAREPNHEILKVVEHPESLFIQNDLQNAPFGIGLREPDRDGDMVETLDAPYRWKDHIDMLWAYLDGEHLSALALTTDEGEIRLFRGAVAPFFERNARCGEERRAMEKEADALAAEARNLAKKSGVAALEDRARRIRVEANGEYWRQRSHCLSIRERTEQNQCLKRITEVQRNAERSAGALEEEAAALARETGVAALRERARTLGNKREECRTLWQEDVKALQRSAQVFRSEAELPPMRYRMRLHQETVWFRRPRWPLYHVHHMEIRDNQSGERIAWARRHYAPVWWFTRLCANFSLDDYTPRTFVKGPGDTPLAAVAMRAFGREPRDNWWKRWQAEKAAGLH